MDTNKASKGRRVGVERKGAAQLPRDYVAEGARTEFDFDNLKLAVYAKETAPILYEALTDNTTFVVATGLIRVAYKRRSEGKQLEPWESYVVEHYNNNVSGYQALAEDMDEYNDERRRRGIFDTLSKAVVDPGDKSKLKMG